MSNNKPGCLGIILQALGIIPKGIGVDSEIVEESVIEKKLPYLVRDDFLSVAELSFFKVLQHAVGDKAVICTKVSLRDLFFINTKDRSEKTTYTNYISRKHVDFVLCSKENMRPICAIELDDSSHERKDRVERDVFVEKVFESAQLPLIRFKNKRSYVISEVMDKLSGLLVDENSSVTIESVEATLQSNDIDKVSNIDDKSEIPVCNRCNIPMVVRTSSRGENKGKSFYGCVNYPKCRETAQLVKSIEVLN